MASCQVLVVTCTLTNPILNYIPFIGWKRGQTEWHLLPARSQDATVQSTRILREWFDPRNAGTWTSGRGNVYQFTIALTYPKRKWSPVAGMTPLIRTAIREDGLNLRGKHH
jgi:hypothetical protein